MSKSKGLFEENPSIRSGTVTGDFIVLGFAQRRLGSLLLADGFGVRERR